MSKKVVIFVLFTVLSVQITAQEKSWFIGGNVGATNSQSFLMNLKPSVGYAVNDWFAVGVDLGIGINFTRYDSSWYGLSGLSLRFTPWHNDVIYIDLKPKFDMQYARSFGINNMTLGVSPSLRFCVVEHWEIATDFGLFGADYSWQYNRNDGTSKRAWSPSIFVNTGAQLSVFYKF